MAPEYAMRDYLTLKENIYRFGVVTLEIVSERNSDSCRPSDQTVYLLDLVKPQTRSFQFHSLMHMPNKQFPLYFFLNAFFNLIDICWFNYRLMCFESRKFDGYS